MAEQVRDLGLLSICPFLPLEEHPHDGDEQAQNHWGDQDYRHNDGLSLKVELHPV